MCDATKELRADGCVLSSRGSSAGGYAATARFKSHAAGVLERVRVIFLYRKYQSLERSFSFEFLSFSARSLSLYMTS